MATVLCSAGLATAAGTAHASSQPATPVDLVGRLVVFHGDDFTTGHSRMTLGLDAGGSHFSLEAPTANPSALHALANRRVHVRGTRHGVRIDASTIDPVGAAASSTATAAVADPNGDIFRAPVSGVHRVAAILVSDPAHETATITADDVRNALLNGPDSLNALYAEASANTYQITATVYGYYSTSVPASSCDTTALQIDAEHKAAADGYNPANFEHVMFIFPFRSACWFGGLAQIGMSPGRAAYTWYNGTLGPATHELGHNFGFAHAQGYECTQAPPAPCPFYEYGDHYDPMGLSQNQFDGWNKVLLGWLPLANVTTFRGSGTYTVDLHDAEQPLSGVTQVVRIARPDGSYDVLDLRAPYGHFDAHMCACVYERVAGQGMGSTTQLLDNHLPNLPYNSIAPGQTVFDGSQRISITNVSQSPGIAELSITMLPPLVVSVQGGTLKYNDTLGHNDTVLVKLSGTTATVADYGFELAPGAGCKTVTTTLQCKGVKRADLDLGDGDDNVDVDGNLPTTFRGGNGNDIFHGGSKADVFLGGDGFDAVDYTEHSAPTNVSFDGVANDGVKYEGDNVGTDVEAVYTASRTDVIVASNAVPHLITAGAGNDTIDTRNGVKDTIDCGPGKDTLRADSIDVRSSCEKVTTS